MSSSDLLDSAKGNQLESGEATFTKVNDDVNVKPNVKLIGLTKEELEKYRNDPFWKTVRYAMFALFWLVWLAMFAGAILIVVISPKCNKGGPKCGDDLINYRIFTPAFRDSDGDGIGDLAGIQEKLSLLKSVGVSGIAPTPLFVTADAQFAPETVVNLDELDARLGGIEQLEALIGAAHDSELCVVADVPLAVSAQNALGAFLDKKGSSAVLDITNAAVSEKLAAVSKRLVDLGVDGLRFTTYGLTSQPSKFVALNDMIKKIRESVAQGEKTKDKSVTIFVEQALGGVVSVANYSDVSLYSGDALQSDAQIVAQLEANVNKGVENVTGKPKTYWRIGDVDAKRYDKTLPIQLLQLVLPGPVNVYYGEELGLLSVPFSDAKAPQRGAMRWNPDAPTFGFSSNETAGFYSNATFNPTNVNFKDELADANSQLTAFKGAADIRRQSGGKFVSERSGSGLSYYGRIFDDAKIPNIVLAVNWPSGVNGSNLAPLAVELPPQFTTQHQLTKVVVKAHTPGMTNVPAVVDLSTPGQLQLNPSQAVLLQLEGSK